MCAIPRIKPTCFTMENRVFKGNLQIVLLYWIFYHSLIACATQYKGIYIQQQILQWKFYETSSNVISTCKILYYAMECCLIRDSKQSKFKMKQIRGISIQLEK